MKKVLLICTMIFQGICISKAQLTHSLDQHPEKGILPYNAPCTDCVEDLTMRTGNTREFFKKEKGESKTIYKQQSLGDMNFKDANGYWITNDPRLKEESPNLFTARQQVSPVVIDLQNKIFSVTNAGKEFRFNKNISLVHISAAGVETNLGLGDWSRVSKSWNYTQTTILVQDFYSGIDLQFVTCFGSVETNFIVKNRLAFTDGWLMMKQQMEIPEGLKTDLSASTLIDAEKRTGMILIKGANEENYFYFRKSFVHDANEAYEKNAEMPFTITKNSLTYFVPVSFLNYDNTLYPVTIDPLVSSSITIPRSAITGSGYTTVCDSFGCSYFMNGLPVPANCTVTNINEYFTYQALLPCVKDDGGISFTMTSSLGSCDTRHFSCPGTSVGLCTITNNNLLMIPPSVAPCIPAPQCVTYNLDFEMKFRRCNQIPIGGCDSTCIKQYTEWIMTIEGHTLEVGSQYLPSYICGDSATIGLGQLYGVPPYTYLWSPSGDTTPTTVITPNGSTQYSVVVTDACGNADSASKVIDAIHYYNPGFVISPYDTVCPGQQVTLISNSPDTLCTWRIYSDSLIYLPYVTQVTFNAPLLSDSCIIIFDFVVDSAGYGCGFFDTSRIVVQNPSAYFTVAPDTTTAHNWFAINQSAWVGPLSYVWYWGDGDSSIGAYPSHIYADTGYYNICLTVTDTAGCTTTYCDSSVYLFRSASSNTMVTINVVSQILTDVAAHGVNENGFSIFPNPSSGEFAVKSSQLGEKTVEIYNVLGEKMYSEPLNSRASCIVHCALPSGIYFVKVSGEKGSAARKLVVE
ncbi:MAG: T9SS type A sorting domain-containing protein [Bacteroidota bacterium]